MIKIDNFARIKWKDHWRRPRIAQSYESADDLYKALEKINKKAEIVRIKDRFIKPAPGGYRDILINVKQSNGHVTELQLHSKQIIDVKGGTGHKLYEKIREINGKAALESRPLSADEFKLRNSLVKKNLNHSMMMHLTAF